MEDNIVEEMYLYESNTAERVDLVDSELEKKPWVSETHNEECEEIEFN